LGVGVGDLHHGARQSIEVLLLKPEVADRVLLVASKPALIGRARAGAGRQGSRAPTGRPRDISCLETPNGSGNVAGESETAAASPLVPGSGPGIKRVPMDGHETDPGVLVEDLLGAVAVVDVEINDQDPLEFESLHRVGRGDRDVIVEAEAHRPSGRA